MSKGKPRHYPDKPANQYGSTCPYYEEYIDDTCGCEVHPEIAGDKLKCGGNRHNCVKVQYQKQAIKKELWQKYKYRTCHVHRNQNKKR